MFFCFEGFLVQFGVWSVVMFGMQYNIAWPKRVIIILNGDNVISNLFLMLRASGILFCALKWDSLWGFLKIVVTFLNVARSNYLLFSRLASCCCWLLSLNTTPSMLQNITLQLMLFQRLHHQKSARVLHHGSQVLHHQVTQVLYDYVCCPTCWTATPNYHSASVTTPRLQLTRPLKLLKC
jgi:hypothetical protein